MDFPFIPTGSLRLDLALGTGGLPRGRISEISGPESSGKTTLCLHLIAEAQKLGAECAFIDVDGALDPGYAHRCGVAADRLHVAEPGYAEQALEVTDSLARCGAFALIVVDSISALVSSAELDIPWGESYRDPSQDLVSRTLRRLRHPIHQNGAALVLTTRALSKRVPVYHKLASNPARLALRLHSAVCLALRTQKLIQEANNVVGQRIQVEVIKNRFSPYRQRAELDIIYNHGIVNTGELLTLGLQCGLIRQQDKVYTFQDSLLGADRETAARRLRDDAVLRAAVETNIRQRFLPAVPWWKDPGAA